MGVRFKPSTDFFVTDVKFKVPNDKGGFDDYSFKGHFAHTPAEELEALRSEPNDQVVRKKLVGWKLTDDDTRQEVPFSPEALESLLKIPASAYATAIAFFKASVGTKN